MEQTKATAQASAAVLMRQEKQVKIYDQALQRKGVIDVYRSLIWTRKYKEAGTVELHAALTEKNLELLQKGNILTMTGSVESAFVEGMAVDDYSNEITATGRMLSSGLSRRGIKTVIAFTSGTYEDAMRLLVDKAAISVTSPLPLLQLGEKKGIGEAVTFQVSYKDLYTYLTKLSACSNLGFRVRADFKNKVYYFEVYEGKDHTENQTGNKRVTFSEVYKNINKATFDRMRGRRRNGANGCGSDNRRTGDRMEQARTDGRRPRHIKNRHDDTAIYSGTDPERNRKAGRMRDRGMLRSSHAAVCEFLIQERL